MSDLHLGARQSQTDKIIKFLEENESETLILNGDIIDGWALKGGGKWKKDCSKIFRRFMKRSEEGTKVVYIRGNHDDFLKPFVPFLLNNIEIVRKYTHIGADGRSYYCFHGDVLDFVVTRSKLYFFIFITDLINTFGSNKNTSASINNTYGVVTSLNPLFLAIDGRPPSVKCKSNISELCSYSNLLSRLSFVIPSFDASHTTTFTLCIST